MPSDYVYKVAHGRVRVEKGDSRTVVSQGAVVNQLTDGMTFGEMSFFDDTRPCANCIADSEEVELLRVSKQDLRTLLEENHGLARDFYKHMAIAVTQRLTTVSAASAEIPRRRAARRSRSRERAWRLSCRRPSCSKCAAASMCPTRSRWRA